MLRLNDQAPQINLRNQFGITTGLQQFRGHFLLLWWQRTFSVTGAGIIARSMRDRYADFSMHSAVMIGISADSPADNRRFSEQLNLPFDLLSDTGGQAGNAYQINAWWRANPNLPLALLVDTDGRIRAIHHVSNPARLADALHTDVVRISA